MFEMLRDISVLDFERYQCLRCLEISVFEILRDFSVLDIERYQCLRY